MNNAFTYSTCSHLFLFPPKGGENREQVSVAGLIWSREHVGNTWEHVKIPHKSREHLGNRSPLICACMPGNTSGTGQIRTAKTTPGKGCS